MAQVSADDLEIIKEKFRTMDKDGNECIDINDMSPPLGHFIKETDKKVP